MRWKPAAKAIGSFIVTVMLLNLLISFAAASSAEFTDVSEDNWAKPYIEKMALKGVITGRGGGRFAPEDKVTRNEVVTMLVRILGYTDIPEDRVIPDSFKGPYLVTEWARKYVAVGVEEGIIAGEDLENFRGDEAAKRYEVAVFAVRALGLEEKARALKNIDMDFKDISEIPMAYRNYVQIAVEKGIITGFEDGTFRPNENISRAQAAALFARVDALLNKLTAREEKGILIKVSTQDLPAVTIRKEDGSERNISVNNSTSIYRHWKKASLQDLVLGDHITVILSSWGSYAEYLEAHEKELFQPLRLTQKITGTVKQVNPQTNLLVITLPTGTDMPYKTASNALIVLDNEVVELGDLAFGQTASIEVDQETGEVVKIKAESVEKEVKGTVYSIFYGGVNFDSIITVNNEDGERETYKISDNAIITRDGKSALLENIQNTDMVHLEIKGSRVVKIIAESAVKTAKGIVKGISFISEKPEITLVSDDKEVTYPVDNNADVERNDRGSKLSDIRKGDKVTLTLTYNIVTEIEAESVNKSVEGTIEGFSLMEDLSITVLTRDNKKETFVLAPDARIKMDGNEITIDELPLGVKGYYVDLRAESDVVVRMDIETKDPQGEIRGKVKHVNKDAQLIVVSVELYIDGKKQYIDRVVYYDEEDTLFVEGNSTVRAKYIDRYLESGDSVTIFGKYQVDGTFIADLVKW
ncbi:Endoglucanase [Koleobacter methoxysyntrophicus]|uniref:Endoglucanase n=1 Tax=Koleobacter methoxysyntrophicus TaxID=2751313 RepID=A0A8A0RJQ7_9FIRM|nr:S-layer homology domain-containing protein [Koleobacter methoxysyntrophicus]QSQ08453.1 Endoglucanase [Koleobacter methoxysyntrophicus]